VLPAPVEPVRVEPPPAVKTTAGSPREAGRLRFEGDDVSSPHAAVAAIAEARWVALAPGSLYASVLSTAAVPDLADALRVTPGRVVWIANLETHSGESSAASPIDDLRVLLLHGIRVDVVLYDPSAYLEFDPAELTALGVEPSPHALRKSSNAAAHDPERLRRALRGLIGSPSQSGARG
jgi:2-phospho-L-lactate transferase/gluconeogenesis factor (CofD/UPF0052 family)